MSNYFIQAVQQLPRKALVTAAKDRLRHVDFSLIACRGISGMAFAPILSYEMEKEIFIVRKPGEGAHSILHATGVNQTFSGNCVIVDDFVSSGNTVREILAALKKALPCVTVVGIHLYLRERIEYEQARVKKLTGLELL